MPSTYLLGEERRGTLPSTLNYREGSTIDIPVTLLSVTLRSFEVTSSLKELNNAPTILEHSFHRFTFTIYFLYRRNSKDFPIILFINKYVRYFLSSRERLKYTDDVV